MELRSGTKQTYGNQNLKVGNTLTILPVSDPNQPDSFRKGLGLPSMPEYMELVKKAYQARLNSDYNMTLKEA